MSNEHNKRLIADGIVEVAAGPQKVTVASTTPRRRRSASRWATRSATSTWSRTST